MCWEDFMANYTHLFSMIDFPDEFRGHRFSGEWTTDNSGGGVHCKTFSINPKYKITINEDNVDIYIQCNYSK